MSSAAYTPAEAPKPSRCRSISTSLVLLLLGTVSIGFIGLGYWLHNFKRYDMIILGKAVNQGVSYGFIVAGTVLLVATLIGFFGICCKKRCFVLFSLVLMLFVLLFGIACGSYIAHFSGNSTATLQFYMENGLMNEYGYDENYTSAWHHLQKTYQCCGVTGPNDYKSTKWAINGVNNTIPDPVIHDSCCKRNANSEIENNVDCKANTLSAIYSKGCLVIIEEDFSLWMKYGSIGSFTLCGLLFLALITVSCYVCGYNQDYNNSITEGIEGIRPTLGIEFTIILILFTVSLPANFTIVFTLLVSRILAFITMKRIQWSDPFYPIDVNCDQRSSLIEEKQTNFQNTVQIAVKDNSIDAAETAKPVDIKALRRKKHIMDLQFKQALPLRPLHVYSLHICLINSVICLVFMPFYFSRLAKQEYFNFFCFYIDRGLSYLCSVKLAIALLIITELLYLAGAKMLPTWFGKCFKSREKSVQHDDLLSTKLTIYPKDRYFSFSPDLYIYLICGEIPNKIFQDISIKDVKREFCASIQIFIVYITIGLIFFYPEFTKQSEEYLLTYGSVFSLYGCHNRPLDTSHTQLIGVLELFSINCLHIVELVIIVVLFVKLQTMLRKIFQTLQRNCEKNVDQEPSSWTMPEAINSLDRDNYSFPQTLYMPSSYSCDSNRTQKRYTNVAHNPKCRQEMERVFLTTQINFIIILLSWLPLSIFRFMAIFKLKVPDFLQYIVFTITLLQLFIEPILLYYGIRSLRDQFGHCYSCRWGRNLRAMSNQQEKSLKKAMKRNVKLVNINENMVKSEEQLKSNKRFRKVAEDLIKMSKVQRIFKRSINSNKQEIAVDPTSTTMSSSDYKEYHNEAYDSIESSGIIKIQITIPRNRALKIERDLKETEASAEV